MIKINRLLYQFARGHKKTSAPRPSKDEQILNQSNNITQLVMEAQFMDSNIEKEIDDYIKKRSGGKQFTLEMFLDDLNNDTQSFKGCLIISYFIDLSKKFGEKFNPDSIKGDSEIAQKLKDAIKK
ncbi:hypothetical protein pb186bvf_005128 [Paramecium bursaria]